MFDLYSIIFILIDDFELDFYFKDNHFFYFFHAFYYLKVFSIILYFKRLEDLLKMYSTFKNWIEIAKLFAIMIIISHIFGIIWYQIGLKEIKLELENNWIYQL